MDLPPPQPNLFDKPPHVFQVPADEVPGNKLPFRHNGEEVSEVEPDSMPDDPMTAKQVVNLLYSRKIVKDQSKKVDLINKLEAKEEEDANFPSTYLGEVLSLKKTKVLHANDLEEVILDFIPEVTMKISSLIVESYSKERELTFLEEPSFQLEQSARSLLQVFRSASPEERRDLVAA